MMLYGVELRAEPARPSRRGDRGGGTVRGVDGQGVAHARTARQLLTPPREISRQAQAVLDEMHQLAERRYVSPYHLALVNCAARSSGRSARPARKGVRHAATRKCCGWESIRSSIHFTVIRASTICCASWTTVSLRCRRLPDSCVRIRNRSQCCRSAFLSPPGENTGDEYLGIGLTDALITRLSNVQRLVVRPTSSVLRYHGAAIDPLIAGRDLGIDYVVDGSLRRVGNRIRVTAQLLSVSEGVTRWAEQFDEDSTDVLQIEDSISEKVASALLPQLTGDEKRQLSKRGTDSSEAFEAYLRGRYYWSSYTEVGLAKALECYQESDQARSGLRARLHRHRRLLQLARRLRHSAVCRNFSRRKTECGESRRTRFNFRRSIQRARLRDCLSRLRLGRRRRPAPPLDRDQSKLRHRPSLVRLSSDDGRTFRRRHRADAAHARARSAFAERAPGARLVLLPGASL